MNCPGIVGRPYLRYQPLKQLGKRKIVMLLVRHLKSEFSKTVQESGCIGGFMVVDVGGVDITFNTRVLPSSQTISALSAENSRVAVKLFPARLT